MGDIKTILRGIQKMQEKIRGEVHVMNFRLKGLALKEVRPSKEERKEIEKGREEIRQGKYVSLDELKAKFK